MKKLNMLVSGSLVFAGVSCLAGDLAIEGNLNVTSNLTSHTLVTPGAAVGLLVVNGETFMNDKLTVSGQRVQIGTNATSSHVNTFVWSDGTVLASTTTNQFSAFALNGFRLLGGPLYGNGYGLTNLNLSATVPTNSVTTEKLVANSVTSAKIQDGSITDVDIAASAAIAQSKVVGLSALATSVGTHTAAFNNPHQVTASQVGAFTTNQTITAIASALSGFNPGSCVQTNHTGNVTINGNLNMSGINRVTNLASPVADGDAVPKAYLRSVLSALPPQGDLSMGSFTDGAPTSFPLTF